MSNRKPIHRAKASAGVDRFYKLVRHPKVIVHGEPKFKDQSSDEEVGDRRTKIGLNPSFASKDH